MSEADARRAVGITEQVRQVVRGALQEEGPEIGGESKRS